MSIKVAYHEAGHALIAELVGISVDFVALESSRIELSEDSFLDTGGYMGIVSPLEFQSLQFEKKLMIDIAGVCAEKIIDKSTNFNSCQSDYIKCRNRFCDLHGITMINNGYEDVLPDNYRENFFNLLKSINEAVNRLLGENINSLEGIANLLLNKRRISGDEVRAIMQANESEIG